MFINKLSSPPSAQEFESYSWKDWFTNLYKWQRTEGIWTPTFSGLTVGGAGGTVTHTARYYKIGNMVYVYGLMKTNGTGTLTATASTYISNLPWPVHQVLNGSDYFHPGHGLVVNAATGALVTSCYTVSSVTAGTYDTRLYFGAFGPTTADHDLTWSCWYQSNA